MKRLVARGVGCPANTSGCQIFNASTKRVESLTTRPGRRVSTATPTQIKVIRVNTGNTPGEKIARPPAVNTDRSFGDWGVGVGVGVAVAVALGLGEALGTGVEVGSGVAAIAAGFDSIGAITGPALRNPSAR